MTDAGDIARMKRIVERIRARGVRVIYVDGWSQRGGTFPVVPNASFVHHDASSTRSGTWGALGIIANGRAGVPPPLSQFQVARGGKAQVAIVAAGIANHAGRGGPHKGLPKDNANRETYGMEVANNGTGEKYSPETIYAIQVVQASIAEECGFGPYYVIGHKEWAPTRKIDPTYSMSWMRNLVKETMAGATKEEISVSEADRIIERIDNEFQDFVLQRGGKEIRRSHRQAVVYGWEHSVNADDKADLLLKIAKANAKMLQTLIDRGEATQEQMDLMAELNESVEKLNSLPLATALIEREEQETASEDQV